MTEVVLVRHGEVAGNIQKKFIGVTDEPLSGEGIRQARALRDRIDIDFYKAFVSPLKRTRETFKILSEMNTKVDGAQKAEWCDFFKERNFGIFENLTSADVQKKYPHEYEQLCNDWENYKIPEGESAQEAYRRVLKGFDNTVTQNRGKKILLVTHLGCIKYILANKIIGNLSGFWHFHILNATYVRLEEHDDFFILTHLNA